MATKAGDHAFAGAGQESMGGPPVPRRVNTHGLGLISTNRGGTKRYYHYDALGTVWALSTGSGLVSDQYNYTAFGALLSSSGSSVNPYRFVGQWGYYDDGEMGSGYGLILLGVRYYSAGFGRFWSWDPATTDLYGYCAGAPMQLIDPEGLTSGPVKRGCAVYSCNHKGLLSHACVDVVGPLGGCSGGAYPTMGIIGCPGAHKSPDLFDCRLVSTDCNFAGHVCGCLADANKGGFGFWDYCKHGGCWGFAHNMLCCACHRLRDPQRTACERRQCSPATQTDSGRPGSYSGGGVNPPNRVK